MDDFTQHFPESITKQRCFRRIKCAGRLIHIGPLRDFQLHGMDVVLGVTIIAGDESTFKAAIRNRPELTGICGPDHGVLDFQTAAFAAVGANIQLRQFSLEQSWHNAGN